MIDRGDPVTTDRIRIDGTTFILTPGQDLGALKQRIEAATSSGSSFIDFDAAGSKTISVLISSGASVRIERSEATVGHAVASDDALPAVCDPGDESDYYDV
jgi:hypothetical protein